MRADEAGYFTPDFFSSQGLQAYLTRSAVIEFALKYSTGHRTVIQAGGHVGVWPRKLSEHFSQVVCFEPVPSNWECLVKNVGPNVTLYREALGAKNGTVKINHRTDSSGGHHIATRLDKPYVTVSMRALDTLGLTDVDALFLDIEGYEIEALKGATRILKDWKPLLVIENNGCSVKFGYERTALARFLAWYGYQRVGERGEDEIYVWNVKDKP